MMTKLTIIIIIIIMMTKLTIIIIIIMMTKLTIIIIIIIIMIPILMQIRINYIRVKDSISTSGS